MPGWRRALAWLPVLLFAFGGLAQEKLEVDGPEPATIRLGDAARAAIRIEGRTANPREFKLPDVDGLRLELSAPTRSSYQFFDGRTLTERTGVQYQLVLRPLREGSFVVPPFPIWTGTSEQMTRELRLDARKDLRGEDLGWLDVTVEPQRVYVHEPIRMRVSFGVQQGLRLVEDVHNRSRYYDVEVQAPWLYEFSAGEPIDLPEPQGDVRYVVGNRQLLLTQFEANHERNGDRWQRFSFEKAYLPTRLGKIELSAPLLRYQVIQRQGQQDIFGRARGQLTDNFYVYGKPITLEVLPIPEAGRPVPYYGAVGRFTIRAAVDKDTVRVGSSVKLTITVGGQGNFEFLRLPALDQVDGFHKLGQAEAKRDADRVVVTYDLLPLSTSVKEVPPVHWNYFDTTPGVEKFQQVATAAVPLTVLPLLNGETLAPLPSTATKAVTPGVDDIFDLPSLAGPAATHSVPPVWYAWLATLGPWLLAVAGVMALAVLRRRAADVDGQRARGAARACLRALSHGGDATEALAAYLGDRLGVPAAAVIAPDLRQRLAAAGLDGAVADEVVAQIERGTAARYGGGSVLEAQAVRELVPRLEGQRFGVRLWLPFVLWPFLVLTAPVELRAQSPATPAPGAASEAVAAYREGDYHTAERLFAQAFEATGDRRLWQARGNCFFRLGQLPEARWAYESARLGLPRDPELLADLKLVRTRLEVDDAPTGFVAELATLRDRLTAGERLWLCAFCMAAAAACLVLGWRRVGLRWIGVLVFVPGAMLSVDALWLEPQRPAQAIALQKLSLVSEPRLGLESVATVRPGVAVSVLGGEQGTFVRIQAGERSGYAPRAAVAIVQ
ncbi:MAG TPA: BatD family protein [Planctomycetota bacterium]|nr:BatD family protein [Planctomycetota bacterium]